MVAGTHKTPLVYMECLVQTTDGIHSTSTDPYSKPRLITSLPNDKHHPDLEPMDFYTSVPKTDRSDKKTQSHKDKLQLQRLRTRRLRVKAQGKRLTWQYLRREANLLDSEFMKALNSYMAQQTPVAVDKLRGFYEQTREIRDRLGPLESEYDQIETELIAAEVALTDLEDSHLELFNDGVEVDSSLDNQSLSSSDAYLPSFVDSSAEDEESDKPSVSFQEFIGKISEVQNIINRLDKMHDKYVQAGQGIGTVVLLENLLDDSGTGDLPNGMFSGALDQTYARTIVVLDELENEALEIRRRCVDQGLILSDQHRIIKRSAEFAGRQRPFGPTNENELPILFEEAPNVDTYTASFTADASPLQTRVNEWLLYCLRDSRYQIEIFKGFLEEALPSSKIDDKTWSCLLIRSWNTDDTSKTVFSEPLLSYIASTASSSSSPEPGAPKVLE